MTIDKDMQTVPGRLYLFNKPELGIREITPYAAMRFHLTQTLTGDTTDEYPELPNVGPVKADAILGSDSAEPEDLWKRVVAAYTHRAFSEDDALLQTRLACILQQGDDTAQTKKGFCPALTGACCT